MSGWFHTLNVSSARYLREGDIVRLQVGGRKGHIGTVVAFDLLSPTPLAVQFPAPRGRVIREQVGADDVILYRPERAALEPLPPVEQLLSEVVAERPVTCGSLLSFPLRAGGLLTFVPKAPAWQTLGEQFSAQGTTVRELLSDSLVTRLPHLVQLGKENGRITRILQVKDPVGAVERLLAV
jgi:hypothetical protein